MIKVRLADHMGMSNRIIDNGWRDWRPGPDQFIRFIKENSGIDIEISSWTVGMKFIFESEEDKMIFLLKYG